MGLLPVMSMYHFKSINFICMYYHIGVYFMGLKSRELVKNKV